MQGSSYAPLQFLRSPWNRDVYTAIDNQIDGRTVLVLYLGAASTLPAELQKYNIGCVLIHKDEKQIYLNTGNDVTPTWESFGPGTSALPTPFVAGQYLTNDGVDAFWSLIDLATGVTGLLDSDHIDLSDLANNSDFIDYLVANSYFTSQLANDSNFLTNLITNLNSSGLLTVAVDGITVTGDGTPGNPLVAPGNGALPLDVQLNGVSVENPVDTINFIAPSGTVTTPSAGVVDVDLSSIISTGTGIITNGKEVKVPLNKLTASSVLLFGDFVIIDGVSYTKDTITGSIIPSGISLSGNSFSISEDGLTLYSCVATGGVNTSTSVTLYTYDINLTLTQTSTYSVGSGVTSRGSFSVYSVTQQCPFFVKNGHLVTLGYGIAAGVSSDAYATDFVISGSSLITPTDTNIKVYQNSGGVTYYWNYATVYNSDVYIQNATFGVIGTTIDKYTYSGTTLSGVIDTHTFPFPTAVFAGTTLGGFRMINSTTIGEWVNSTITENTWSGIVNVATNYFSAFYSEYTF